VLRDFVFTSFGCGSAAPCFSWLIYDFSRP
jgi:hypothetical protein